MRQPLEFLLALKRKLIHSSTDTSTGLNEVQLGLLIKVAIISTENYLCFAFNEHSWTSFMLLASIITQFNIVGHNSVLPSFSAISASSGPCSSSGPQGNPKIASS